MIPPSVEEIDARLRPWWADWYRRLPEAQQRALTEYKADRYLLYAIAAESDREFTEADLERFERLDAAFSFAPALSSPCRVWRGMTRYVGPDGHQPWTPPTVGEVQSFPSWTSVSLREEAAAAEAYAAATNRVTGDYGVLMELTLPVGQRYIYIEVAKPHPTHEAELLLPRGTRYRVLDFAPLTAFTTLSHVIPGPHAFSLKAEVIGAS